jgi:hypothetical protein
VREPLPETRVVDRDPSNYGVRAVALMRRLNARISLAERMP